MFQQNAVPAWMGPKNTGKSKMRLTFNQRPKCSELVSTQHPFFIAWSFFNYLTKPARWEAARLFCLHSQDLLHPLYFTLRFGKGGLITQQGSKQITLTDVQITQKQRSRRGKQMREARKRKAVPASSRCLNSAPACQSWTHIFVF